ncbi:MAG: nicotinate-nucleotide--dimethylbenzimidazole phosphoribosyltransferase [Bacteroidota bacterium]
METQLQHKIDFKTKPIGSLGKLESVALQIGKIQKSLCPELRNPTIIIFAADHGIVEEGVSPFPKEVTFQMLMNFLQGGAAINVFCKQNGLILKVVDAGVDYDFDKNLNLIHAKIAYGTKNILKEPAMSVDICQKAMDKGREIVKKEFENGCNIIGFGEMGIGNTSAAALLMNKYTGISIEKCTGKGTGHTNEGLDRKIKILKQASEKYCISDSIEILACYGGLEIAMMCGAMIEAKKLEMTILIDGFICTAALIAAFKKDSSIIENCIFCHSSDEKGHKKMLEFLNVEPLISIGLRLGEGSGVAVAFPLIISAVAFLNEMASFEDAGVTNKD